MKKILLYMAIVVIMVVAVVACSAEISTLPSGVSLSQSSATLAPGETLTLISVVTPDEATIKTLTWSSSNPDVATVVDGVVTANYEGFTLITVTTNSGQKSVTCIIMVMYPVSGIELDRYSALLPVGKSLKLTATVIPDEAPDKTVIWSSSDPAVAEVVGGVVTAKTQGTAFVSAITEVGRRIARCTLQTVPENYRMMTLKLSGYAWGGVSFSMSGTGEMKIDWGDGSAVNSYTLSEWFSGHNHNYYNTGTFILSIAGENVTNLQCIALPVTNLDVSDNTALTSLNCSNAQLTSLDVSKNTALTELNCSNNQLSVDALNALFNTLHDNPGNKTVNIRNNPGTNHSDLNPEIAEAKGWNVFW